MRKVILVLFLITGLLLTPWSTSPVNAAAYGTSFTTSITYQNVGTASANITILFYPEANSNPITITRPPLAPMAGTSVYVGSLSEIASGFKGSAVIQSDQPLVATLVQVPSSASGVKSRPLSNAFATGSSEVGVPTVLKNMFGFNSIVSIQNVDSGPVDITLTFTPVTGLPISLTFPGLPAGSAKYYDLGKMNELGPYFNGALRITAKRSGTNEPGRIIASSMELGVNSNYAYAFEGTTESGNKAFMPSALCKYASVQLSSAYAVQNVSSSEIQATVRYSSGVNDGPYTIPAGGKRSFETCAVNAPGFLGSAIVEATGNIVAVGKVYGGGLYSAFLGFTSGASRVALPYIRYTQSGWTNGTRQRAFIAIQNVGTSDLPAGAVSVKYYDKNGRLVGTHLLGAISMGGKVNSDASKIGTEGYEFGYYPDGTYGGAAVVEGPPGSQLAVVVRVQTYISPTETAGEDYTGIPIP